MYGMSHQPNKRDTTDFSFYNSPTITCTWALRRTNWRGGCECWVTTVGGSGLSTTVGLSPEVTSHIAQVRPSIATVLCSKQNVH